MDTRTMSQAAKSGLFILLLAVQPMAADEQAERTWTSSNGKFTVKATYLKSDETSVYLRRHDGTELSVDLQKLSTNDQEIIRQLEMPVSTWYWRCPARNARNWRLTRRLEREPNGGYKLVEQSSGHPSSEDTESTYYYAKVGDELHPVDAKNADKMSPFRIDKLGNLITYYRPSKQHGLAGDALEVYFADRNEAEKSNASEYIKSHKVDALKYSPTVLKKYYADAP